LLSNPPVCQADLHSITWYVLNTNGSYDSVILIRALTPEEVVH